jgi:hypothetical protein
MATGRICPIFPRSHPAGFILGITHSLKLRDNVMSIPAAIGAGVSFALLLPGENKQC